MSPNTLSIADRLEAAVDTIPLLLHNLEGERLSSFENVIRHIIDDINSQTSSLLTSIHRWETLAPNLSSRLRTELRQAVVPQQPDIDLCPTRKRKEGSGDSECAQDINPSPAKRTRIDAPESLRAPEPSFQGFVAKECRESVPEKQAELVKVAPAINHDFHGEMLKSVAQEILQAHTKIREEDTRQFQLRIDAGQVEHLPPGTKLRDLPKLPQAMMTGRRGGRRREGEKVESNEQKRQGRRK